MEMGNDTFSCIGNGIQVNRKVGKMLQKKFEQVQSILDQNKVLINEINQNHKSRIAENLSRNVGLIRELNNNIARVVSLYGELPGSVSTSMGAFSAGESTSDNQPAGKGGKKRSRPT